ncbi:hypothetical protein VP01_1435g4 [Puccinia sorghi]|uniref:Uncharacterized protein n=1 Tax=Puccinia sorghi TaxID=27349 RepID=A0A0L6VKC3_9BASI|nr:hypothetical protein VP01_1435g4 [Puccinia sorghi]
MGRYSSDINQRGFLRPVIFINFCQQPCPPEAKKQIDPGGAPTQCTIPIPCNTAFSITVSNFNLCAGGLNPSKPDSTIPHGTQLVISNVMVG